MSHPTPLHIPDTLPEGATKMTPAELNRIRFSSRRTVITPAILEAAASAAATGKRAQKPQRE